MRRPWRPVDAPGLAVWGAVPLLAVAGAALALLVLPALAPRAATPEGHGASDGWARRVGDGPAHRIVVTSPSSPSSPSSPTSRGGRADATGGEVRTRPSAAVARRDLAVLPARPAHPTRPSDPALWPLLLNFALIATLPRLLAGLLPRPDGELPARWWLTALPLLAAPLFAAGAAVLGWRPLTPVGWQAPLTGASLTLSAASVFLIARVLGSHGDHRSTWEGDGEAPHRLVTHGPYARVRHPLYAAFLLALLAALALLPHGVTLAALCYGGVALHVSAAREERRMVRSPRYGAEYRRYMARTGRFLPALPRAGIRRPGRARG
ncbi:hypothetical protein GCM10027091_30080 [Streptomyces daliensis]